MNMLPKTSLKLADIKPAPQSSKLIGSAFHLFDETCQAVREGAGYGDTVDPFLVPLEIFVMMKVDGSRHFTETICFDMSGKPPFNIVRVFGSLLITKQKSAIENLCRVANGGPFENFHDLVKNRIKWKDYPGKPPILAMLLAFEILEINPLCRQFFGGFSQMFQLRVQPSIHAPRLASHGKSHCFLMPSILLFIAADHLTDGVAGSKNCCEAGDQRLKIEDQITQPITAALVGDHTWMAEYYRQGDSNAANKHDESEQSLFVKIRQRFPLKPLNRSQQVALFASIEKRVGETRCMNARSVTRLNNSLAGLSQLRQGHDLSISSLGTLFAFDTFQDFVSYRRRYRRVTFETLPSSSQAFWRVPGDRRERNPTSRDHQGKPMGYCSVESRFHGDGLPRLTGSPRQEKLLSSSKLSFSSEVPPLTAYPKSEHSASSSNEHSLRQELCRR
ncbi:hypothetical protein FHR76_002150 [Rhizobium sp. RAS22]|nr:hypothetical protein [Rhizobium sp. RAS22]